MPEVTQPVSGRAQTSTWSSWVLPGGRAQKGSRALPWTSPIGARPISPGFGRLELGQGGVFFPSSISEGGSVRGAAWGKVQLF